MKKEWLVVVLLFCCWMSSAQREYSLNRESSFYIETDSIQIDSVSIRKIDFEIFDENSQTIDSTRYRVDFSKARLYIKDQQLRNTQILVKYSKYPDFLTKTYAKYAADKIVGSGIIAPTADRISNKTFPFEGLNSQGSITRGITVGNNQNAVVNSTLDLQISGKLSDKITLRASIQDSYIPAQTNGYSQRLDEFDQIFIELAAARWNVRAGDLFLENRTSRFLNFSKKVQGVKTNFKFGSESSETNVFASAALVRGAYARSSFTGVEGNQGPYRLTGANGETFILVISGSERVFVNGILLQRGENNQYIIDYNAGEVTFTPLFQITSEMRINIEYQYAERNFTRVVSYGGASHQTENWQISGAIYSESDVKNQPLQQSLSEQQVEVLKNAGDDERLMIAPSESQEPFDENKIQYRKELLGDIEIYVYSTNPDDVLYNVRFTDVGQGNGNYVLENTTGTGKIYGYRAPDNGVLQGSFEPVIRLIAPEKLQMFQLATTYRNDEKTTFQAELAGSINDRNLFSDIGDENNTGLALNLEGRQLILKKKLKTYLVGSAQFIGENFRTVERAVSIEFNRDWNVGIQNGDQKFATAGLSVNLNNKGIANYRTEVLQFGSNYSGVRQLLDGNYLSNRWRVFQQFSYLNSAGNAANSTFLRNNTKIVFAPKKSMWLAASHAAEDNVERLKPTQTLSNLSQRFNEFGGRIGVGDSLSVFVEAGVQLRYNDSLKSQQLVRVNRSLTYSLRSRILQSEKQDLMFFAAYRNLVFEDQSIKNQPSLNSRVTFNGRYLRRLLVIGTTYENSSGAVAQQEFTYLAVEPGRGLYMWNDYNNNGIKELEEFEIAPFPDQAIYIRVFLPNQVFVPSHVNRLSQNLTLNFSVLSGKSKWVNFLKKWSNQTAFITERKIRRGDSDFDLNPFGTADAATLGQVSTFRNSLFFNRGKQNNSITLNTTSSRNVNFISTGLLENTLRGNQFLYAHLLKKSWLLSFQADQSAQRSKAQNFSDRNFDIHSFAFLPKVSYLFSQNANLDFSFSYGEKKNLNTNPSYLVQRKLTMAFNWSSEKQFTANGDFNLIGNQFSGEANTAAAFQMLEALQPGQNLTWRLSLQKSITGFLDITINYQGRKSDTAPAIHTGTIQVRAHF